MQNICVLYLRVFRVQGFQGVLGFFRFFFFRLFQEYLGLYFYFVLCLFCVIASLLLQKMQNICVLYLRVQGFKVEKPPFCTVLRLIVNFRHCASSVEQGFVPNHVNPCVCYFPRVQGFRVQSFQGFMVFRVFQVILGIFRVIFLFRIVFVLCDCITFVTKNAKYLCTISQGFRIFRVFRVLGFFRVFLGFLQILLFKVEKPPFCTVLRLIVNFRHCASPVEQGFVPNHVNPCVCYFPRVQGFRVQSFQGFMVFRVFQVILGIFRVIFLFRIVFVLCDCITFVTKNAKYLCTISQGLGFLGFQGFLGFFQGFQGFLGYFRNIQGYISISYCVCFV